MLKVFYTSPFYLVIKRWFNFGNLHSGFTCFSGMIIMLVGGSRRFRQISEKQIYYFNMTFNTDKKNIRVYKLHSTLLDWTLLRPPLTLIKSFLLLIPILTYLLIFSPKLSHCWNFVFYDFSLKSLSFIYFCTKYCLCSF